MELEKAEQLRDGKDGPDFSQVFGADFGPESKESQESDQEKAGEENLGGKESSGGENPGQTQPGGWLQQQNTVITEPASVPFAHDAKEQDQEHSDRDDDDGMRITAKGRI